MSSESQNIKPCPFCGSEAKAVVQGASTFANDILVICQKCCASGPPVDSPISGVGTINHPPPITSSQIFAKGEAIRLWNTRRGKE